MKRRGVPNIPVIPPIPVRVAGRTVGRNRDGDHDVILLQGIVSEEKDVRQIELMNPFGEKTNPPDGMKYVAISIGSAWKVAVAGDDEVDVSDVNKGEKKLYSTDEDGGSVVTKIHLKNDGTIDIEATINHTGTMNVTQDVVINGVSMIGHTHKEHDGYDTGVPE